MSSWNEVVDGTCRRLGLRATALSAERRAAIALLRTGLDLSALFDRMSATEGEREHSRLLAWLQEVDPKAGAELLAQLLAETHQPADLTWVASFSGCEDVAVLPPPLLLLSLLTLLPSGSTNAHQGWPLLDAIARLCGGSPIFLSEARGWLDRVAAPEVRERLSAQVAATAAASAMAGRLAAELHRVAEGPAAHAGTEFSDVFSEARERFRVRIAEVLDAATPLGLEVSSLKRLQESIQNERFRVAVLGEFKRGKSTLTNALLGTPDLLPAEILPCTSALIELRHGDSLLFEERGAGGRYLERQAHEFRAKAGAAGEHSERRERGELVEEEVPRWRVRVPSEFLADATLELVDTPGLGEDAGRDEIARSEALRADAAILVFSAKQLASKQELDLVESMGAKLGNLILAVNYSDLVPSQEWPRLRDHVLVRLRRRNLDVPAERIAFVSAKQAEDAIRGGPLGQEWMGHLEALRGIARTHLLQFSGQRKAAAIATNVSRAVQNGRRSIETKLQHYRQRLSQLENLAEQQAKASQLHAAAKEEVLQAAQTIGETRDATAALISAFDDALPGILEKVDAAKEGWTSAHSPLGSPRKHVEEVAKHAEQAFVRAVGEWVSTEASAVLARELAGNFEKASANLSSLRHYLEHTMGSDADGVIEEMKRQSLEEAFDGRISDVGGGQAGMKAALMGVMSLVIGYVVADVVLYYMLGAISGFLNPFLLAAALVVGLAAFFWKGDDWVRGWVRSTVSKEVAKGAQSEKARESVHRALRKAATEVFGKMSDAFRNRAGAILEELRAQDLRLGIELEMKKRELGTPEALTAELERVESVATKARAAFQELEQLATRVALAARIEPAMQELPAA